MKRRIILTLFSLACACTPTKVHGLAVDGPVAYLATADDTAELVVIDLRSGETLGTFDAEGPADGLSVKVVAPGIVKLGRRKSDAPEVYRLDVSDPANIRVLAARQRSRRARWKQRPLPPVLFRDVNGDGVYRLACLGDSNTARPTPDVRKWCEVLEDAIADPRFEVVNMAVGGATVAPHRYGGSDATAQMLAALDLQPDAVVLAFGTNDRMHGRKPNEIRDAYLAHAEVAELAGLAVYVATTPPTAKCVGEGCPLIAAANEVLLEAFGDRTIDFFTGFEAEHLMDALHLNAAGQELRAERALRALVMPPAVRALLGLPPPL